MLILAWSSLFHVDSMLPYADNVPANLCCNDSPRIYDLCALVIVVDRTLVEVPWRLWRILPTELQCDWNGEICGDEEIIYSVAVRAYTYARCLTMPYAW